MNIKKIDIEAVIRIIDEVRNFYDIELVEKFSKENEKIFIDETLGRLTKDIKRKLKKDKYKLETFAWVWGYIVFENARKLIIQEIKNRTKTE